MGSLGGTGVTILFLILSPPVIEVILTLLAAVFAFAAFAGAESVRKEPAETKPKNPNPK